jgi:hypothetical protein
MEIREHPPSTLRNGDGEPPGRWCQISKTAHHQRKKHRRRAPWEAVAEIQERPPSTQKMSMVGPLGGNVGDLGAPTINARKHQWWTPLGGGARDPGAPTINARKHRWRPPWEVLSEI